MLLDEITEPNEIESVNLECKARLNCEHMEGWLKTIAGFSNAGGYDGAKTKVQCSVFAGFDKGSERIVTVNRFAGSLTDSVSFMLEFVTQRMNHALIKRSDSR